MTVDNLMELVRDEVAFKKAFRKTDAEGKIRELNDQGNVVQNSRKNEIFELLSGKFSAGRAPFIHQVVLPDGGQIRIKFYDTIKKLFSNKNVELVGKESFLSYMEVTVAPPNMKAYCWTMDVDQLVWGTSKSKAKIKHDQNLASLKATATGLGIDMTSPSAWATIYTENY